MSYLVWSWFHWDLFLFWGLFGPRLNFSSVGFQGLFRFFVNQGQCGIPTVHCLLGSDLGVETQWTLDQFFETCPNVFKSWPTYLHIFWCERDKWSDCQRGNGERIHLCTQSKAQNLPFERKWLETHLTWLSTNEGLSKVNKDWFWNSTGWALYCAQEWLPSPIDRNVKSRHSKGFTTIKWIYDLHIFK